jgi:hypothetical protein
MVRRIARRSVLLTAAAAVPTASALARSKGKKKQKKGNWRKAFRLVTGCRANGGCSCNACEAHAANKLFASQAAVVRAHEGCNCVVEAVFLKRGVWVALFGPPAHPTTPVVDKRHAEVQEILG